jgi:hypothetical protein
MESLLYEGSLEIFGWGVLLGALIVMVLDGIYIDRDLLRPRSKITEFET